MTNIFWPEDARLVLTLSVMFEAGAQVNPDSIYLGPLGPIDPQYPDLAGDTYFEYGYTEALPRLLDVFDFHGIKTTVFPVGKAAQKNPDLLRDMAKRGHEIAAHGVSWVPQHTWDEDRERAFIKESVEIITNIVGVAPKGWNCWGLRRTVRTLDLLQENGFTYHIDDVSQDNPFVRELANGKPFATVPYTLHNNDLLCYEALGFSTSAYVEQLKREFDWLYEEAKTRRRMMPIPCHDRTLGRPARVHGLNEFLTYALGHPGVTFMRRGDIADFVLDEYAQSKG
jgi:peptidoglycan/xylan/chitin deacetylase (PgdA/CDA1 family)